MDRSPFRFSVILPVYGEVSDVITAIESVRNQSLDFRKDIQLILIYPLQSYGIYSGSLEGYRDKYPDNILLLPCDTDHTSEYGTDENRPAGMAAGGTVSGDAMNDDEDTAPHSSCGSAEISDFRIFLFQAWNVGLDYVEGEYICIARPDREWNRNTFKIAESVYVRYPSVPILGIETGHKKSSVRARLKKNLKKDLKKILGMVRRRRLKSLRPRGIERFRTCRQTCDISDLKARFRYDLGGFMPLFCRRSALGEVRFDPSVPSCAAQKLMFEMLLRSRTSGVGTLPGKLYPVIPGSGNARNASKETQLQRHNLERYVLVPDRVYLSLLRLAREIAGEEQTAACNAQEPQSETKGSEPQTAIMDTEPLPGTMDPETHMSSADSEPQKSEHIADKGIKPNRSPLPRYIQLYIARGLMSRSRDFIPGEYLETFCALFDETVRGLNDGIFREISGSFAVNYRIQALQRKYGFNIMREATLQRSSIFLNKTELLNLSSPSLLVIQIINVLSAEAAGGVPSIELRGLFNLPLERDDYRIEMVINEERRVPVEPIDYHKFNDDTFLNSHFVERLGLNVRIPLNGLRSIRFEIQYREEAPVKMGFVLGMSSRIHGRGFYYTFSADGTAARRAIGRSGGLLLLFNYRNSLEIRPATFRLRAYFSFRRWGQLLLKGKFRILFDRAAAALYGWYEHALRHREIWILVDRPAAASDNAYALFRWLNEEQNKNTSKPGRGKDDEGSLPQGHMQKENGPDRHIRSFMVIMKNSADFEKVRNTGEYLIYRSREFRIRFLAADKVISSQAGEWVYNPYGRANPYYRDRIRHDLVFLQHGITKDDVSGAFNCYAKNFRLFITAAQREYESILQGSYGFGSDVVKLTGFPRHDLLHDESRPCIAVMPTWRRSLSPDADLANGTRRYSREFRYSEYCAFYNRLINDPDLLQAMRHLGYNGLFVVHPNHQANAGDFQGNDIFRVVTLVDYSRIFNESCLMVTDYSSVVFDFAWLDKPVIYTQFDRDTFFQQHTYTEGYYDYERDGFGPVCTTYESSLQTMLGALENGCRIQPQYLERIHSFYPYRDRNNCRRVYEEICALRH